MKKIISLMLVLFMMTSVLTSCDLLFNLPFVDNTDGDNGVTSTPDNDPDEDINDDGNKQEPPVSDDGGGGNTELEINYGTQNNPVITTYAHDVSANLGVGESSARPFYVKGTVTDIGEDRGNYYKNVYFTDGKTHKVDVQIG